MDPRTFPATDTVLATTCEDASPASWFLTYSIAADGTTTGIGTAADHTSDYPCTYGGAFNAIDGKFYSIQYEYSNPAYTLITIDPTTGAWTPVAAFNGDQLFPESLAIAPDGTAYVTHGSVLSHLDLSTATVTDIPASDLGNDNWRIAVNPVDGKLYGISDGANGSYNWPFALINATNGTIDTVYAQDPQDAAYYSLAFDSAGTAWVVYTTPTIALESCTFTDPSTTCVYQGDLNVQDDNWDTYSLLIGVPKAALPDTGVDASTAWSVGAFGALVLMTGGAILVIRRRARISA